MTVTVQDLPLTSRAPGSILKKRGGSYDDDQTDSYPITDICQHIIGNYDNAIYRIGQLCRLVQSLGMDKERKRLWENVYLS
jgi:hypothetical protein